jgi:hypothetical protein
MFNVYKLWNQSVGHMIFSLVQGVLFEVEHFLYSSVLSGIIKLKTRYYVSYQLNIAGKVYLNAR